MLDRGEGVIEMMKQAAPPLILGRLSKPDRMILDGPPMDQQNVSVRDLHTATQLVREVSGHRRYDSRCLVESGFKVNASCRADIQDCNLKDRGRFGCCFVVQHCHRSQASGPLRAVFLYLNSPAPAIFRLL